MKLQRQTAVLLGLVSIGVAFGCSSGGGGGGGGGASLAPTTSGSTAAQTTSSSTVVPVAPVVTAAPVALSPSRFLYVADFGTDSITPYAIDAKTGKLTAGTAASPGPGSGPYVLAADSKGRFLYSTDFFDLGCFAIDPKTGALTQIVGSSATFGSFPWAVTVDPSDGFVVMTDGSDETLYCYKIGATGALSDASTLSLPGSGYGYAAFSPDGKFVYVTDNALGAVYSVAFEAGTGKLALVDQQLTGVKPDHVALDPAGKFVYVANSTDLTISIFSRNAGTGKLTPVGTPVACLGAPGSLTFDAAGKNLYVPCDPATTSGAAGNVLQVFAVDAATGNLTASANAATVTTGDTPVNLVIDASGNFAFSADFGFTGGDTLDTFKIDPKTGVATATGTPMSTGPGTSPFGLVLVK